MDRRRATTLPPYLHSRIGREGEQLHTRALASRCPPARCERRPRPVETVHGRRAQAPWGTGEKAVGPIRIDHSVTGSDPARTAPTSPARNPGGASATNVRPRARPRSSVGAAAAVDTVLRGSPHPARSAREAACTIAAVLGQVTIDPVSPTPTLNNGGWVYNAAVLLAVL